MSDGQVFDFASVVLALYDDAWYVALTANGEQLGIALPEGVGDPSRLVFVTFADQSAMYIDKKEIVAPCTKELIETGKYGDVEALLAQLKDVEEIRSTWVEIQTSGNEELTGTDAANRNREELLRDGNSSADSSSSSGGDSEGGTKVDKKGKKSKDKKKDKSKKHKKHKREGETSLERAQRKAEKKQKKKEKREAKKAAGGDDKKHKKQHKKKHRADDGTTGKHASTLEEVADQLDDDEIIGMLAEGGAAAAAAGPPASSSKGGHKSKKKSKDEATASSDEEEEIYAADDDQGSNLGGAGTMGDRVSRLRDKQPTRQAGQVVISETAHITADIRSRETLQAMLRLQGKYAEELKLCQEQKDHVDVMCFHEIDLITAAKERINKNLTTAAYLEAMMEQGKFPDSEKSRLEAEITNLHDPMAAIQPFLRLGYRTHRQTERTERTKFQDQLRSDFTLSSVGPRPLRFIAREAVTDPKDLPPSLNPDKQQGYDRMNLMRGVGSGLGMGAAGSTSSFLGLNAPRVMFNWEAYKDVYPKPTDEIQPVQGFGGVPAEFHEPIQKLDRRAISKVKRLGDVSALALNASTASFLGNDNNASGMMSPGDVMARAATGGLGGDNNNNNTTSIFEQATSFMSPRRAGPQIIMNNFKLNAHGGMTESEAHGTSVPTFDSGGGGRFATVSQIRDQIDLGSSIHYPTQSEQYRADERLARAGSESNPSSASHYGAGGGGSQQFAMDSVLPPPSSLWAYEDDRPDAKRGDGDEDGFDDVDDYADNTGDLQTPDAQRLPTQRGQRQRTGKRGAADEATALLAAANGPTFFSRARDVVKKALMPYLEGNQGKSNYFHGDAAKFKRTATYLTTHAYSGLIHKKQRAATMRLNVLEVDSFTDKTKILIKRSVENFMEKLLRDALHAPKSSSRHASSMHRSAMSSQKRHPGKRSRRDTARKAGGPSSDAGGASHGSMSNVNASNVHSRRSGGRRAMTKRTRHGGDASSYAPSVNASSIHRSRNDDTDISDSSTSSESDSESDSDSDSEDDKGAKKAGSDKEKEKEDIEN